MDLCATYIKVYKVWPARHLDISSARARRSRRGAALGTQAQPAYNIAALPLI
jgi:hypothetical protein